MRKKIAVKSLVLNGEDVLARLALLERAISTLRHINDCEWCGLYYAGGTGRQEKPCPQGDAAAVLAEVGIAADHPRDRDDRKRTAEPGGEA